MVFSAYVGGFVTHRYIHFSFRSYFPHASCERAECDVMFVLISFFFLFDDASQNYFVMSIRKHDVLF